MDRGMDRWYIYIYEKANIRKIVVVKSKCCYMGIHCKIILMFMYVWKCSW